MNHFKLVLIIPLITACTAPDRDTAPPAGGIVDEDGEVLPPDEPEDTSDADGDGVSAADGDCDDSNPALTPFATDIAGDGIDQNCDGIDGTDADGDGVASVVSGGSDCDDNDAATSPSAPDSVADGRDQSCDGVDGTDADRDGYASVASGGQDCDDANSAFTPADEDGDGASSCDGDCDDDDPELNSVDDDGDGFSSCDGDCDDTRDWLFPYDSDEDGVNDACGYRAISAGYQHACAIDSAGEVLCWGDNSAGQASPPRGAFSTVAAGYFTTCGITESQTIQCWGENAYGEATPPSGSFSKMSWSGRAGCALTTGGQVQCWGTYPTGTYPPPPSGTFIDIRGGSEAPFCALASGGSVTCFGRNEWTGSSSVVAGNFSALLGSIGGYIYVRDATGNIERWYRPSAATLNRETTVWGGVFTIAEAQGNNFCGIRVSDHSILCAVYHSVPGSWRDLAVGGFGSPGDWLCAISDEGGVGCWGNGPSGQLLTP